MNRLSCPRLKVEVKLPVRDAVMERRSEVLSLSIWWIPSMGLSHLAKMESPWPQSKSLLLAVTLLYCSYSVCIIPTPIVHAFSFVLESEDNKVAVSFKLSTATSKTWLYWAHCSVTDLQCNPHVLLLHCHESIESRFLLFCSNITG